MDDLTINEVLCFVSFQSDKVTTDYLHKILLDFYSLEEVTKAKALLISEFDKVLEPELIKEQRKSRLNGKVCAKDKIVKDILDIWQTLDRENAGSLSTQFVACDVNRLPLINADKCNLQFLVSSILQLQDQARQQEEFNQLILNTLLKVNKRLEDPSAAATLNRSLPPTPVRLQRNKRKNESAADGSDDDSDGGADDEFEDDVVIITQASGTDRNKNSRKAKKRKKSSTGLSKSTLPTPQLSPALTSTPQPLLTPSTTTTTSTTSSATTLTTVQPTTAPRVDAPPTTALADSAFPSLLPASSPALTSAAAAGSPPPPPPPPSPLPPPLSPTPPISAALLAALSVAPPPLSVAAPLIPTATTSGAGLLPVVVPASSSEDPASSSVDPASSSEDLATLLLPPAAYADAVKSVTTPGKWNLAKARKNKKIVPVVGSGVSDILKGVPAPSRDFWDISVSRLVESATEDQVRRLLHLHGIEVKEIFLFASKIKGTKSARVRVARAHRDRAKDANVWPHGCRVADWVRKQRAPKTPSS